MDANMGGQNLGSGSLQLDNRRKQCVRNWFEKTDPKADAEVEQSSHDLTFSLGPWGETLAFMNFLFLHSVVNLTANPIGSPQPIDGEPYVAIPRITFPWNCSSDGLSNAAGRPGRALDVETAIDAEKRSTAQLR
jgi:hypothetical protein